MFLEEDALVTIDGEDARDFDDAVYELPDVSTRELANRIGKKLDDIRRGRIADPYGWVVPVI